MRLTLNYSAYTVISACTHPVIQIHLPIASQEYILLQLKIHNIWMKFFWNQKIRLGIKEISTLKPYIELSLLKLFADICDSSFLLDYLSKANLFPNFSAGNSELFFNRFWNVRFSDRWHFIVTVFFLKKTNAAISNFSVLPYENKCSW